MAGRTYDGDVDDEVRDRPEEGKQTSLHSHLRRGYQNEVGKVHIMLLTSCNAVNEGIGKRHASLLPALRVGFGDVRPIIASKE